MSARVTESEAETIAAGRELGTRLQPGAVVLLEGPRAGELATAALVTHRDENGDPARVEFVGKTAFGPHPDPPRIDAALEWCRRIQRRTGGDNAPLA